MSEIGGTKLPIQNVRSPVANGGKADNICSLRDLPVLTRLGHRLASHVAEAKPVSDLYQNDHLGRNDATS